MGSPGVPRIPQPCRDCPTLTTGTRCPACKAKHAAPRNRLKNEQNAKYRTPEWRKLRTQILRRDHYTCAGCGTSRRLQVHHADHDADNPTPNPLRLVTVCERCHTKIENEHRRGWTNGTLHRTIERYLSILAER